MPAASFARPTAPSRSNRSTTIAASRCGRAGSGKLVAQHARLRARHRPEQFRRRIAKARRRRLPAGRPTWWERSRPAPARSRSAICGRSAAAARSNSRMRAGSGIAAVSNACQIAVMPNNCSAATKATASGCAVVPSSSINSKGWIRPRRLTIRLASLVAMISRRSRCVSDLGVEPIAHRRGERRDQVRPRAADLVRQAARIRVPPASPAWRSTASPRVRAGSGRDHRRRGGPGRSPSARPSVAPVELPASSSSSISRICAGIAATPPASAIDSASACRRLSSSTSAATSSVIAPSSLTRASSVSRPERLAEASAILMLTSLSEQSTPAELSMKSVLIRPPYLPTRSAQIQSGRPGCSPGSRLRRSPWRGRRRPSTRSASLAGSPTVALFSVAAFT